MNKIKNTLLILAALTGLAMGQETQKPITIAPKEFVAAVADLTLPPDFKDAHLVGVHVGLKFGMSSRGQGIFTVVLAKNRSISFPATSDSSFWKWTAENTPPSILLVTDNGKIPATEADLYFALRAGAKITRARAQDSGARTVLLVLDAAIALAQNSEEAGNGTGIAPGEQIVKTP